MYNLVILKKKKQRTINELYQQAEHDADNDKLDEEEVSLSLEIGSQSTCGLRDLRRSGRYMYLSKKTNYQQNREQKQD